MWSGLVTRTLNAIRNVLVKKEVNEIDAIYGLLYLLVNDLDGSKLLPSRTQSQFDVQWRLFPEGEGLLSDLWFRDNVDKILCEQELLIRSEWFPGRRVLDAGCGNGRWAYGFSKLGVDLTCVDGSQSAIDSTKEAIKSFRNRQTFIRSALEELDRHVNENSFDLVFCWGVLHHVANFTRALDNLARAAKEGGVIYIYLYGRESLSIKKDLELFKERLIYNFLLNDDEKMQFLLKKARGDKRKLHKFHDIYSPIINRRLEFDSVVRMLQERGFGDVERTIDSSELFVRAFKGGCGSELRKQLLPKARPPYWFQRYG